jgi:dihydrofolate synthase / folylpolyglutamate synthase
MNPEYFALLRRLSQPIRAAALPQTLAHVTRLLNALGSPQTRFPSVVVAGSTGKGSTCLRLADYLSITGRKVGLYTSPHLHSFRERMVIVEPFAGDTLQRLQPHRISQAEFVEHAHAVLAAEDVLDTRYSTFESATALALLWLAHQKVDIAVLEVGIGGRFDAVNAVANTLAIFTPIEAEHIAMLGGSLESVAWHKAGIIQPDRWAITVPQSPEVMAVLEREAAEKNATLQVGADPVAAISEGDFFSFPPRPACVGEGSGVRG